MWRAGDAAAQARADSNRVQSAACRREARGVEGGVWGEGVRGG